MADRHATRNENLYSMCPEIIEWKISQTMYEISELEVVNQELGSLQSKSKVYVRRGAGNVFFLSDHSQVTSQYKRKLDDAKQGLAHLNELKQVPPQS